MRNKGHIIFCILAMCMLFACTKNFQDINTDQSGITEEDMNIDFKNLQIPLGIIQQGIYFNYDFGKGKNWPFQMMQNLNADMFSGYMHDYKPLNGGSSNSDYNLQDGWNGTNWGYTYAYIFPQIKKLEDSTKLQYPTIHALAKILKVEVMHRISDYYGPIVYSSFGDPSGEFMPDTQQEAYYTFFDDLDIAVDLLAEHLSTESTAPDIATMDIILDGKYQSWIKFANSLRMRLAIRIAMADPQKARTEFVKALNDPYGVFELANEQVAVSTRDSYQNPLGEINRVWNEAFMNASMESILNGYEDPRREVFFEPCPDDVSMIGENGEKKVVNLKGKYKGIRQGTCFSHLLYASHSKIYVNQTTDAILMTAAEVWFLRAEAALRGWTGENVEACYRQGVNVSFQQWRAMGEVDGYLDSDRIGADYIDAFDPNNNIEARCKVSPRWLETASNEEKLEKIITQKWLAVFPEGCEAWAEQRRTGYPRLFPVRFNNSRNGSIDTEIMIRRLNFPAELADTDPEQYQALVRVLGGEDSAGARLWWDTGRNF
ncbi:SusD/RagB family nutrient-binding outer membrane lipoprotein [Parabacteroides bouchesdurhonensis]|uniref:SusD/RagB family nutrient-binding outer membrane lipoprotein n=1 Tax=Parabacteroides bouchesdurhonensis TaxID=1936995 RepID=UPI000C843BDA|nr:SusD/RagB family nutrient-binding outer membrane lipoprotein [Parabacteroides bouchesdurhonensis]